MTDICDYDMFMGLITQLSSFRVNYTPEKFQQALRNRGISYHLADHIDVEFRKRDKDIIKFCEYCDLQIRRVFYEIVMEGLK